MSYGFYKILHLAAIFGIFMSLGALALHSIGSTERKFIGRKWTMIMHGVGMLVAFVAGFGLMARTGIMHNAWPMWIYLKLVVWLVLGAMPALILRSPKNAKVLWIGTLAWGVLAIYLVNFKPGV